MSNKKKADLLIVDDKPENLKFLSSALIKNGYHVRSALSGQMAVTAAQAVLPDMILLDVKMPGMDGYQVCSLLKADPETRGIPIIFISALGEIEDKVKALFVGGVDYITKPFQIEEVLARVSTHLTLRDLQCQLEEKNRVLARQISDLNNKNKELDAFAHTVAHDLKNPLSVLSLQTSWLEANWPELPPEEIFKILSGMGNAILKTGTIIDELLLLASVRKGEVKPVLLNTGQLITEVRKRQENLIHKYNAQIFYPDLEDWPDAFGHPQWVEEVWANYISNAIKYGGEPPQIHLGFRLSDTHIRFEVSDNGAGLTVEQQEKLFTAFERLDQIHARGHGLGLSVVRRIVDKLGGDVGVDSKIGKGSTFWFTLPKTR